jgi:SPP1 family predicted phage head-tail adaptor
MNLSGGLRHRVDIQARTNIQDATTGEVVPTWSTVYSSVPAKIEPLSVREFMAAKADQSDITTRITIRYRTGLSAEMRILHGSTIYNPAGFLPDKESGLEYLTIPCGTGVNDG